MPEINGQYISQEVVATVVSEEQEIEGSISLEGEISAGVESAEAEISGLLNSGDDEVTGILVANSNLPSATLTVHYGADGKDGKDGFSPIIDVYKKTKKEYILKITDVRGSYLTPNLIPDIDEILDIEGKVDEDLLKYKKFDPTTLDASQRKNTFLYAHKNYSNSNEKIALSDIALTKEVDEKIRLKLQTVKNRPDD